MQKINVKYSVWSNWEWKRTYKYFQVIEVINSNYNLRGDAILKLPKVNSMKHGIKSWRHQAARLRNTISNNLRNIDSYRCFKRGLKELDLLWGQDSAEINIIKQNQCIKYIKSYLRW